MMERLLKKSVANEESVVQVSSTDSHEESGRYVQANAQITAASAARARIGNHFQRNAWVWVFLASFAVWGLVMCVVFSALSQA